MSTLSLDRCTAPHMQGIRKHTLQATTCDMIARGVHLIFFRQFPLMASLPHDFLQPAQLCCIGIAPPACGLANACNQWLRAGRVQVSGQHLCQSRFAT